MTDLSGKKLFITDTIHSDELLSKKPEELIRETILKTNIWNLENKQLHLFIRSCDWTQCVIKVDNPISIAGVPQLSEHIKDIRVLMSEEVARESAQFLCDTFPSKAPFIRRAIATRKSILEVLRS